jgi:hypothetical protein
LRSSQRIWIGPALVLVSFAITLNAQERTFTVRDSIEMNTLSDPNTLDPNGQAKFSPDGKHYLVVTTRGILQSDRLESCLMVFDTSSVSFAKHETTQLSRPPKCVAKLAAVPQAPRGTVGVSATPSIIMEAQWSSDSKSIYFLGQGEQSERKLYRVNIVSGTPKQLSPFGYDVNQFDSVGKVVVYFASRLPTRKPGFDESYGQPINQDALDVTGISLQDILFPRSSREADRAWQVWTNQGDRRPTMITSIAKPLNGNADFYHNVLSISPDGAKAVILVPVTSVPRQWDNYEPSEGHETVRIHAENADSSTMTDGFFPLKQYALVDLYKKRMMPLFDAPTGTALSYFDKLKAVWSEDGRRLLLTNTFMPIGGTGSEGLDHPLRPCAVASIELSQRNTRCIVPARRQAMEASGKLGGWTLDDVSFGADSDEVLATFEPPQQKPLVERYRDTATGWVGPSNVSELPVIVKTSQNIEVYVRQGLNNPPTLWAKSVATGEEVQVWDPNPGLKNVSYGEASLYHWKDSSGYEWSGILVKPVGYTKGERYPLVIQTHGFRDWAFITDGIYPSAMAARPLASAGIAVLQTDYRHDDDDYGPPAAGIEAGKFESAVQQLTLDGIIDPKRVGIIGFSHTCWQVESTLILKPTLFRAATMANGLDNSYMQYLLWGVEYPAAASQYEKANSGKPFGVEGLNNWLRLAPGFRLNGLKAPLRLEEYGEGGEVVLNSWETYSSLRLQGKPVDLIRILDDDHVLQTPLGRMASQQGNVDWFRFWLQDYERPNPEDPNQYKRWEHLRDLQNAEDKADGQPNAVRPN